MRDLSNTDDKTIHDLYLAAYDNEDIAAQARVEALAAAGKRRANEEISRNANGRNVTISQT